MDRCGLLSIRHRPWRHDPRTLGWILLRLIALRKVQRRGNELPNILVVIDNYD